MAEDHALAYGPPATKAVALDPFRVDLTLQLVREYFFARDYNSALPSARQVLAYDPNQLYAQGALCDYFGRLKLFDESVAECSKELALEGHTDWVPAHVRQYHERGYEAARLFLARKDLHEILKRPQPDLWGLANGYVSAGKREETLRILFQGLPTHEPGLLQLRVDPDFDSIRDHPRYAELVRQISFPTE